MSLALFLLFLALGFFLASTRQFRQPERTFIWLMGAGLLAIAIWRIGTTPDHYGLLRALWDGFSGDAVARAFARNLGGVSGFITQLLDFFVLAAAALGIICLIAFTPGERIEQAARPTILVLLGFMAGAVAALAVVAIGLGGQIRPRTYVGMVTANDVYDGDTFSLGEVSLRLWGVDAPELRQECRDVAQCGVEARAHLVVLLDGAMLQCDQKQSRRSQRVVESFGRPLVRCWARRPGQQPVDIGGQMIRDGYAVQYLGDTSFGYRGAEEEGRGRGLMRGCMLRPDLWRNDNAARRAFENNRTLPADAVMVGACPVLETSAQ